jgi:hypothetical protein
MKTNAAAIAAAAARRNHKRDESMASAAESLLMSIESIVAAGGADKNEAIAESLKQFEAFAKNLATEADDADDEIEEDAAADVDADDLVSRVVAAHDGKISRAAALEWLLSHPMGREVARHKGDNMSSTEEVIEKFKRERIAKLEAMPIVEVAKIAISAPDALLIDETEYTALVTRAAKAAHPGLSASQAFSKMFADPGQDSVLLRRAWAAIKSMPIQVDPYDVRQVGGEDARAVNDPEKAIANLKELGRRRWPTASEAQQFARAFTDPANAELAKAAHQRPVAPENGFYPFPR